MNELQQLMEQLRERGWSDLYVANFLGISRTTVFRWRTEGLKPHNYQSVMDDLRRLLRLPGPSRKDLAGVSPAR